MACWDRFTVLLHLTDTTVVEIIHSCRGVAHTIQQNIEFYVSKVQLKTSISEVKCAKY